MTREFLVEIIDRNLRFGHVSSSNHVFIGKLKEENRDDMMLRFERNSELTFVSAIVVDSYKHLAEFIADWLLKNWNIVKSELDKSYSNVPFYIPLPMPAGSIH